MQNHEKPISVFPVTLIYSTAVFGQPLEHWHFRILLLQGMALTL